MDKVAFDLMIQNSQAHWWFRARRDIFRGILRWFSPLKGRVLEIGCGSGENLELLKEFGQVEGVESDPACAKFAAQRLGVPVACASLPGPLEFSDGSFDLVALFDVLEHVKDDRLAILEIRRLLKNGGCLVLSVPAFQWLWSQHDVELHHRRRYTLGRLSRLLQEASFKVEYRSYCNFFLFPLVALIRIRDKLLPFLKTELKDELAVPSRPVNQLLYRIFSFESRLLGRLSFPFGVSVLVIARKQLGHAPA